MNNANKVPETAETRGNIFKAGSVVLGAILLPGCAVLSQIPPKHDTIFQHTTVAEVTQPLAQNQVAGQSTPVSLDGLVGRNSPVAFNKVAFNMDNVDSSLPRSPGNMPRGGSAGDSLFRFDEKKSAETYSIALLPALYANTLYGGAAPEYAENLVRSRVDDGIELSIIKHQNVIAVVTNDASQNKVVVAFNPTNFSQHADKIDNFKIWPHTLPAGEGKVHKGYFDSLSRTNEQGQKFSDAVRAQVEQYVAQNMAEQGKKTNVTVTGISRGGALAEGMAYDWMKNGMPGGDDARLKAVTGFMAVGFGDKKFSEHFMQLAGKHGVQVMNVKILGDYLTNYMSGEYKHVGDAVYFIPQADGVSKKILLNPTRDELKVQLKQMGRLASVVWHDPNIEAVMMGVPKMPQLHDSAKSNMLAFTYPAQNYLLDAQKLGFLWREHPVFSAAEKSRLSIVKDGAKTATADKSGIPEGVFGSVTLHSGNELPVSYVEKNKLPMEKTGSFVEKSAGDANKATMIAGISR